MVSKDILQSVFYIRYGINYGTCFLVSIEKNMYYITARHLFPNILANKTAIEIEIFQNGKWNIKKVRYLVHTDPKVDITVLDLKMKSATADSFDLGGKTYFLSQDCFFLGYPFGLKMEDILGKMNNGFPIPFIKKAIISSFITDASDVTRIYLDGHNNPGFSGGPVVISNNNDGSDNQMRIIGVVSSYLNDIKVLKTKTGNYNITENSGIVLSYHFDIVFDII